MFSIYRHGKFEWWGNYVHVRNDTYMMSFILNILFPPCTNCRWITDEIGWTSYELWLRYYLIGLCRYLLHWYRLQDIQDSQRYLSRGRACIFEVQVSAFIHNAYLVQTSWHIYRSWIVFTPRHFCTPWGILSWCFPLPFRIWAQS